MNDDDIDDIELREAEALAAALDRGRASEGLPDDALETAALLRYSEDGGALAPDREDALLEEVLHVADRVAAREPRRRAARGWVFGGLGLAAGLALLIALRPEPPSTVLPTPSARLLQAQLARMDDASHEPRFDDEMRAYRGAVYSALEARYEAR